jgi:DNA-binding protein YbaB
MKHLKPFNEAVGDTFAQDLKDFCEMNLAYLLDDGEVRVNTEGKTTLVKISINNSIKDNNPYSVKSSRIHPDQVQLEDLVISYFQFFVKK